VDVGLALVVILVLVVRVPAKEVVLVELMVVAAPVEVELVLREVLLVDES
jgi:hypothetical protein